MTEEIKKYSVNDAVWIATALMAAERYTENPNSVKADMYFKQADIVHRAQTLAIGKVDSARVSWWVNADSEKHTQNYLRADSNNDPSARRLSMMDEFPEKTYPEALNPDDEFLMAGWPFTMEELLFFVREQYPYVICETKDSFEASHIGDLDYNPGISKEQWTKLLHDKTITLYENLRMFKMMLEIGGESTCANLAETYGGTAASYNGLGRGFGERVYKKTGCPLCKNEGREKIYPISFIGRNVIEKGKARYSWKIRPELKEALEEMDLSAIDIRAKGTAIAEFGKNMILCGPPGTGKTYYTAIYAVAICDGRALSEVQALDYEVVMERYEKLKKEGRIAFTTFHQSYGYEEFIEGIKPSVNEEEATLGYTIESGIFKKFCERAEIPEQKDIKFTGTVWNIRSRAKDADVQFDYDAFLYNKGVVLVEDIEDRKRQCNYLGNLMQGDLVVLGREFRIFAVGIVTDNVPENIEKPPFHWQRKVNWIAKALDITFADIGMAGGCISNFAVAKSKIKVQNLANIIKQKPEIKPYVFIIDEINRGNVSKIFGELITLIESTKRKGMSEATSAVLPYSGTEFGVPNNIYILGTMNTADRSIALMDTALRRRFQFVEMMPDVNVLREIGADYVEGVDVAAMLEKINERISFLYDREHTIGHAFFTKLAEHSDLATLQGIFEKSVIPLLQEYFYEDYQKIQLVLGDNGKDNPATKFILDEEVKVKSIFKGNADDAIDLPEKKYSINHGAFSNIESYKQII